MRATRLRISLLAILALTAAASALLAWPLLRDDAGACRRASRTRGEVMARLDACTRLIEGGRLEAADLVDVYLHRADAQIEANPFGLDAIDDASQAIHLRPDDPGLYARRGRLYATVGRSRHAIDDADRAMRLAPHDGTVAIELYRLHSIACQDEGADERTTQAGCTGLIGSGRLGADDLANAHARRGSAHWLLRQPERAMQDFDEAIRLAPNSARAPYRMRGQLYASMGQHQRAIQDLGQAIQLAPSNASLYSDRARIYMAMRQPERAIEDFDQAIRFAQYPRDAASLYVARGRLYASLGQHERAIQDFDQALRIAPDVVSIAAYYERGTSYAALGQRERAVQDLDQAIRAAPDNVHAFFARAWAYAELGQHQRAIEDYDRLIALRPSNATVSLGLSGRC